MGRRNRTLVVVLLGIGLLVTTPASPAHADGNEMPAAPLVARSLTAGVNHTCALFTTGRVKCWGQNGFGTLGLGDGQGRGDDPGEMGDDLPFVDLGTGRTATALSAGSYFNCAILDGGDVKCWGSGAVGNGSPNNVGDNPGEMGDNLPIVPLGTGRTATAISAGDGHTCAILDNGTVKCWGGNTNGQLGLGDTNSRGFSPNQMGDALPAVPLGTGRTATAISAGYHHTCALLDNGTVKCWGYAGYGALGYGNENQLGDQANEMGDNLPAVNLGATAISIAAGGNHSCAILTGGSVRCWGQNSYGQLSIGSTVNYQTSPTGALSLGAGRTAIGLSLSDTTCVLLDDDTVRCLGRGADGQLGRGIIDDYGNQAGEVPSALPAIPLGTGRTAAFVTTGQYHTCARLDDGTVKCFGFNVSGQLGQGDQDARGDGPNEMGDDLPAIDLGTATPVTPTCDGQVVTVNLALAQTPTAGNDVILGTGAANTINGLGGADRICGGGGIDTINGGPGNDRLFGDGANDKVNGGDGADTLNGGIGNDTITGGDQNDTANGGDGNDTISGQNGNDTLNGQVGADTLNGAAGNDRLNGGTQRDTCNGGTQADTQTGCEVRTSIP